MAENAPFLIGMAVGTAMLVLAGTGGGKVFWSAAAAGAAALTGAAWAGGNHPGQAASGILILAAVAFILHRHSSVLAYRRRQTQAEVDDWAREKTRLEAVLKSLEEENAEVDRVIEANRRIYEITRDLGGVITMKEFRRETGRLLNSLFSPSEMLLVYLNTEGAPPTFYRIFDLLTGTRIKEEDLPPRCPIKGYFSDPTKRGILTMEKGPQGPERIVFYLTHKDRIVGGIFLDGVKAGSKTEIDIRTFLYTLAVLLGLANNKCLLYLEIEKKSRYDALTGLFKRWYFEDLLSVEIERAGAEGDTFVLLMLDIDHFKDFNDTFGHLVGDDVLKMLGVFLKEHVRAQDIVCRYGGEEFAVALLDTDRDGAKIVSERLRASIAERPVNIAGALSHITVSIGGAVFPEDAADIPRLVHLADEALYRAKREGRNRVVFHRDP